MYLHALTVVLIQMVLTLYTTKNRHARHRQLRSGQCTAAEFKQLRNAWQLRPRCPQQQTNVVTQRGFVFDVEQETGFNNRRFEH
jgi:ribosome-associated toxin RatA of RatAB toxin-antitoxin module